MGNLEPSRLLDPRYLDLDNNTDAVVPDLLPVLDD
jgi:hypothetical protein